MKYGQSVVVFPTSTREETPEGIVFNDVTPTEGVVIIAVSEIIRSGATTKAEIDEDFGVIPPIPDSSAQPFAVEFLLENLDLASGYWYLVDALSFPDPGVGLLWILSSDRRFFGTTFRIRCRHASEVAAKYSVSIRFF